LKPSGSRGYLIINFKDTCLISGVDRIGPMYWFRPSNVESFHTIVRSDFVDYCYGYLSYKFGLTNRDNDVVLRWSDDEWKFANDRVYRNTLLQDCKSTVKILDCFKENFLKSDAKKINY